MNATGITAVLAKTAFQLAVADVSGKTGGSHRLRRARFKSFVPRREFINHRFIRLSMTHGQFQRARRQDNT